MRPIATLVMSGALALGAACSPGVAPTNPSWDVDVNPILRGSCLHCHAETAAISALNPAFRFDVCNPADFMGTGASVAPLGAGATGLATLIVADLEPEKGKSRAKMPPPPALPLSEYEITVLKNWLKIATSNPAIACKRQTPNRPPTAKLAAKPVKDGNKLIATIDVSDPDGDQVVGRATAGSAQQDFHSIGRRKLEFDGAGESDTIKVKLTDGYDTTNEITLDKW